MLIHRPHIWNWIVKNRLILLILYLSVPVVLRFFYAHLQIQPAILLKLILELICLLLFVCALLYSTGQAKHHALRFAEVFVPASLVFILEFLEFISYYLQGTSFDERFVFHISLNTVKIGARAYAWLAVLPLLLILLVGMLDCYLSKRSCGRPVNWKAAVIAWGCAVLAGIVLPNAPKHFLLAYYHPKLSGLRADRRQLEGRLQQYHANVRAFSAYELTASPAPDSKNLLLLYLESLEAAYFDESRFPDLVPPSQASSI